MSETAIRFEHVPRLLGQILFELKRLNNGPGIDAPPFETDEPKTAEPQTGEVTHEEMKKLCLTLNRKSPENKGKIKEIISEFTDGKLADIDVGKLSGLKTRLEALNG